MNGIMFSKSFRWPLQINMKQVMLHICYLCKTGDSMATRLRDGKLGNCGLIPSSSTQTSHTAQAASYSSTYLMIFIIIFTGKFEAVPSFRPLLLPFFFLAISCYTACALLHKPTNHYNKYLCLNLYLC
jgi:hypothetical protein